MPFYSRVVLYFDGASRHNPHGPAGCGYVLYCMDGHGADDYIIEEDGQYLGYNVSNNQAEYQGLINGLEYIRDYITCNNLYIRGDSEIVIKQLLGEYEVRSSNIRPYYKEAKDLLDYLDCNTISYRHISRSNNYRADKLANNAIDDDDDDVDSY